jgi:peroxiredoxin
MIKIQEKQRIPAFSLPAEDGCTVFNSDDFLRKKNLVILISLDLEKSSEYLDMLDGLYPDLKFFDAEIVAITSDEKFKKVFKNIYLLQDSENRVAKKFADESLPTLFITDKFHTLFECYIDKPVGHLPSGEQIIKTIEYIESSCPECSDSP